MHKASRSDGESDEDVANGSDEDGANDSDFDVDSDSPVKSKAKSAKVWLRVPKWFLFLAFQRLKNCGTSLSKENRFDLD